MRDVPIDPDIVAPAAEVFSLLNKIQALRDVSAGEPVAEVSHNQKTMAELAVLVFQFSAALDRYQSTLADVSLTRIHRHFRVLKDQMLDAVTSTGLSIEDPGGKTFDDIVEIVSIDGWRHSPSYSNEIVAEVIEPVIRSGDDIIRPGRVIMGGPLPPDREEQASPGTIPKEG